MELIEGRSLSDLLTATGLSIETVSRYGAQIADALAHAHGRGIVHRDLKGSNVMVTPEGRVKVLDFGLATRLEREEISELTLSHTPRKQARRHPPYMAPEVCEDKRATTSATYGPWAYCFTKPPGQAAFPEPLASK